MTFLVVFSGALLGSVIANVGVFWFLGAMAKRAERKQVEELHRLQAQFIEMRQREAERIRRYAEMEG
jgi:uncharacterized membrane protein YccC